MRSRSSRHDVLLSGWLAIRPLGREISLKRLAAPGGGRVRLDPVDGRSGRPGLSQLEPGPVRRRSLAGETNSPMSRQSARSEMHATSAAGSDRVPSPTAALDVSSLGVVCTLWPQAAVAPTAPGPRHGPVHHTALLNPGRSAATSELFQHSLLAIAFQFETIIVFPARDRPRIASISA